MKITWYEQVSGVVLMYHYEPEDAEDLERKLEELRGKDTLRGLAVQNNESPLADSNQGAL